MTELKKYYHGTADCDNSNDQNEIGHLTPQQKSKYITSIVFLNQEENRHLCITDKLQEVKEKYSNDEKIKIAIEKYLLIIKFCGYLNVQMKESFYSQDDVNFEYHMECYNKYEELLKLIKKQESFWQLQKLLYGDKIRIKPQIKSQ